MYTATITSQGQITIPSSIRSQLGLIPGDQITFNPHTQTSLIISKSSSLENLQGVLSSYKKSHSSYNEADIGSADYKKKWLSHGKNPR